jgi:aspartyl protease family protein
VVVLGYVRVRGTVANPVDHDLKVDLEFLVDTGAIYTVISKIIADRVKLKEVGKRKFRTGSGVVELPVAEGYMVIEGEGVTSLVAVSYDEEMPVLLGVTTLELLGLQVDPVTGKLKPLELLIL